MNIVYIKETLNSLPPGIILGLAFGLTYKIYNEFFKILVLKLILLKNNSIYLKCDIKYLYHNRAKDCNNIFLVEGLNFVFAILCFIIGYISVYILFDGVFRSFYFLTVFASFFYFKRVFSIAKALYYKLYNLISFFIALPIYLLLFLIRHRFLAK